MPGSKGPLYLALARATAQAAGRFAEIRTQLHDAQAHCRDADEHASQSEKRATQADRHALTAEKRLASAEAAVAERQALLGRADALCAAGFDDDARGRLGEVRADAAQAEGKPTANGVAGFLDVRRPTGASSRNCAPSSRLGRSRPRRPNGRCSRGWPAVAVRWHHMMAAGFGSPGVPRLPAA